MFRVEGRLNRKIKTRLLKVIWEKAASPPTHSRRAQSFNSRLFVCRYSRIDGQTDRQTDRTANGLDRYNNRPLKPAFYDADTDFLARILADTSDTRDFLKLWCRCGHRGMRALRHRATWPENYTQAYLHSRLKAKFHGSTFLVTSAYNKSVTCRQRHRIMLATRPTRSTDKSLTSVTSS